MQDFDNRQLNIIIRNNLRLLGIKSCNKSTKILAKTIFYVKSRNILLEDYKANEIIVVFQNYITILHLKNKR